MIEGVPQVLDLALVAEEDMFEELRKRYDVAVFVGYKQLLNKSIWRVGAGTGEVTRWIEGPIFAVVGLMRTELLEVEYLSLKSIREEE